MKEEKQSNPAIPMQTDASRQNHLGFPYRTTLSFVPFIEQLEKKVNDQASEAFIINEVLKKIKAIPELMQPIVDITLLKKYRAEIDLLLSLVLPSSVMDGTIAGVLIPFQPVTVYASPHFKELFGTDENGIWNLGKIDAEKGLREIIAYYGSAILSKYYNYEMVKPDMLKSHEWDKVTGSLKFYQPDINPSFARVIVKKEPKPLSEIDLSPLKANFFDTNFWIRNFPPDTFEIEGFVIYRMFDITDREMISQLEFTLLQSGSITSPETIRDIETKFRTYLQVPELKIGIAPMLSYAGQMATCGGDKWNCFVPYEKQDVLFDNMEHSIYSRAIEQGTPYLIEDIAALADRSPVEEELLKQNIRSIIIVPILQKDELIGAIEIGSEKPHAFNFISMMKMNQVIPLISVAFQRAAKDFETEVQTTIKEHFTSIHPSVEWKFAKAALDKISKSSEDEEAKIGSIDFNDVTPVYGQIDIRGSSEKRNEAIRQDLIDYLLAARRILEEAQKDLPLAILDELVFRIDKYLKKLREFMDSGDESGILDFMRAEVEPALRIISDQNLALKKGVENFHDSLNPEHDHYHMRRKSFEESLTMINDIVARILDEEEDYTQEILPHYFEKYKTDGVEYNLYLGQSILQNGNFDPIHIRSFRLWQLITMVKIARETHRLLPFLSTPLETTQLILCYSNPFAITFRMDEKRFDVAGAYNIRYEIVKKRIDKAHVKGTDERITQPHQIAIIYTQDKEAREYERYCEYLQSKKLVTDNVEYLEVEPLQGLQGLKALRITINYEPTIAPPVNYDEEELWKQVKDVMV